MLTWQLLSIYREGQGPREGTPETREEDDSGWCPPVMCLIPPGSSGCCLSLAHNRCSLNSWIDDGSFYRDFLQCWDLLFFFLIFIYLYGCAGSQLQHARSIFLVACRIFSCGMQDLVHWVGSSSPTRDWTRAPCTGSSKCYPLEIPGFIFFSMMAPSTCQSEVRICY